MLKIKHAAGSANININIDTYACAHVLHVYHICIYDRGTGSKEIWSIWGLRSGTVPLPSGPVSRQGAGGGCAEQPATHKAQHESKT